MIAWKRQKGRDVVFRGFINVDGVKQWLYSLWLRDCGGSHRWELMKLDGRTVIASSYHSSSQDALRYVERELVE